MAAREDQPQPVVGDDGGIDHVGTVVDGVELGLPGQRVGVRFSTAFAAQAIEGSPARGRQQPGARARGDTPLRPVLEGQREGFLDDLLGGVEIADDPRHRGDHARVLQAEDLGHASL